MALQEAIPLPPTLDITTETDGCAEKWETWKKRWISYATITKLSSENGSYQLELFRYCLSDDNVRLLEKGLSFDEEDDRQDLTKILEQFDEHFGGGQNEIYESYRFFTRQQEEDESLRTYITQLKILAKSCNFGPLEERLVRDRIVCGMSNRTLQKRFLEDSSLTLAKCERRCRCEESAAIHGDKMQIKKEPSQLQSDIDAVQTSSRREARTILEAGTKIVVPNAAVVGDNTQ